MRGAFGRRGGGTRDGVGGGGAPPIWDDGEDWQADYGSSGSWGSGVISTAGANYRRRTGAGPVNGFRRSGGDDDFSEDFIIPAPAGPFADPPPSPRQPGASYAPDVPEVREALRLGPGGRPLEQDGRRGNSPLVLVGGIVVAAGFCYGALRLGGTGHTELPMPTMTSSSSTASTSSLDEVPGQLLGHYLYALTSKDEAPQWDLVGVENKGFATRLRTSAARSFEDMQMAARRDGITLLPVSGFRSVKDQEDLYYGISSERNQSVRDRAKVSAPPGYSEHHTGYALDIATAPFEGLNESFEQTRAFRWLERNANRFHFELSFPKGNEQKVLYEPWHWRFVGDIHATQTFYRARGK